MRSFRGAQIRSSGGHRSQGCLGGARRSVKSAWRTLAVEGARVSRLGGAAVAAGIPTSLRT